MIHSTFNESIQLKTETNLIEILGNSPEDNRLIIMSATILEQKQNDKRVLTLRFIS